MALRLRTASARIQFNSIELNPVGWIAPAISLDPARHFGVATRFNGNPITMRLDWPDSFWNVAVPDLARAVRRLFHTTGYRFMPDLAIVDEPWRTTEQDWKLEEGVGWERYEPGYARFETLRQQTALFRRGLELLAVVKADARVDASEHGYALFAEVGEHEDPPRHDYVRKDGAGRGVFVARLALRPQLLAVESWGGGVARRSRFGTGDLARLRADPGISDILLFAGAAPAAPRLEDVLEPMLANATVRSDTLGLYWEVYGVAEGTAGTVQVRVERERSGLSGLISGLPLIGGGRAVPGVRWSFEAAPDAEGVQAFAVSVPLAEVAAGEHTVTVTCRCGGRDLRATRKLMVLRGS